MQFKILGVGAEVGREFTTTNGLGLPRISLFPLRTDNKAWMNTLVRLNGQDVTLSLFSNPSITDFGIKIKEESCYNQLVALFQQSSRNLNVPLESAFVGGTQSRLSLLGEIFWL